LLKIEEQFSLSREQNLKFSVKAANKTAASAAQLAKCILLQQLHIAYLTNWHNSIFGFKLRTVLKQLRLKIIKKLRTASLNSEFTGSYKQCTGKIITNIFIFPFCIRQ